MDEIRNKVEESNLIQIDLEKLFPVADLVPLDLSDYLSDGFILKEKPFRDTVSQINLYPFHQKIVYLYCTVDAIVPDWAYLLITQKLLEVAKEVHIGTLEEVSFYIKYQEILAWNFQLYEGKKLIIKGCANSQISIELLNLFFQKCLPFASSIMFGEACSAVPLYKTPKNQ